MPHPEYLIGKGLAHCINLTEIEFDRLELLQTCQYAPCLRSGHVLDALLVELNMDAGFAELV